MYVDRMIIVVFFLFAGLCLLAGGFIAYTEVLERVKKPLYLSLQWIYKLFMRIYIIEAEIGYNTLIEVRYLAISEKQAKWKFFVDYGSKPVIKSIHKKHKKHID